MECSILEIDEPQFVIHKGVRLISFDMVISTNVVVPNYIGLGKAVSHGFGVVSPLK
ncbi:MAG: CRISPR-associated endonuclease Cas6 [Bacteroidales bacterium]